MNRPYILLEENHHVGRVGRVFCVSHSDGFQTRLFFEDGVGSGFMMGVRSCYKNEILENNPGQPIWVQQFPAPGIQLEAPVVRVQLQPQGHHRQEGVGGRAFLGDSGLWRPNRLGKLDWGAPRAAHINSWRSMGCVEGGWVG